MCDSNDYDHENNNDGVGPMIMISGESKRERRGGYKLDTCTKQQKS